VVEVPAAHPGDVRAGLDRPQAGRRQEVVTSFGYKGQADYEAQHALGAFDAEGYELRRGDKVLLAPTYANGNERVGTIEGILYYPVSEKRRPDVRVSFPQSARLKSSTGTWLDTHLLLSHQARVRRLRLEQPTKPTTPTSSSPAPAPAPAAALLPMSKFIVSSSALLKVLQPLAGVITNNPVVPTLSNFLFNVTGNTLAITASDLEVSMITSLPVETNAGTLDICVPSRILLNLLKQLPDQPITFDVNEEEFRVEIRSANGNYKLSGENAADYPKVPSAQGNNSLEIPSSALLRAISKTIFAVSTDELRPAMTGILFQMEQNRVTFVATDGHRLLRYRRLDVGAGYVGNVIVPRKAWAMLKSALPSESTPVQASFSTSNASFSFGSMRIVTRLIDERYPDYENVIPISNPNTLRITRLELLRASQRCSLMANKTTHQIRLRLTGAELQLSADDLDFGNEARETLACQYDGTDMEIGFNSSFLHEMLGALDNDEVTLSMSTPNRAGLIEPGQQGDDEDVLMLVMPVMLNNYV
jgi:DNA polymerase-3 subunit beta